MKKIVYFLSLGSLSLLSAATVVSCAQENNSDKDSKDINYLMSKISINKINKLDNKEKNLLLTLKELLESNNSLINKFDSLKSQSIFKVGGKFQSLLNLIDGPNNSDSLVKIVTKIANKIGEDQSKGREVLSSLNKIFEHVVFNKIADLTEDLNVVLSGFSKEKHFENSLRLVQYILQRSDNKNQISFLNETLPSLQFLDKTLNLLNQEISNTYFDENYYNKTQKSATPESILEKDFSEGSEHHHDHEHETDEESHSHSHSLMNLLYNFYQSVEILVKKVDQKDLIQKLNDLNKELPNDKQITQEIQILNQTHTQLKQDFSKSLIESENEIFKRTVLDVQSLKNLLSQSAQLSGITLRETITKIG
ncbi:hypothetical protein [Mycoplasmopsis columboralis]|uniref:Lipoprotein n=1 Tax=Mycoplasmopsis columboralis TaxID=171282 RepID=A0A449B7B6_9BACT|nr:hypothetical protein [Mycoplasmopsis columboralis]VEU76481.1 Uncharacterised protein [Mycoplasmopsis columboralis]